MEVKSVLSDEKTLVNVFQNVSVAVHGWYIDKDSPCSDEGMGCRGASIVVNDAFCRMVEYSPSDIETLLSGQLSRIVFEDDRESYMLALHELYEYPHEKSIACRIVCKSGRMICIEDRIRLVRQADGSIWLYASVTELPSDRPQCPAADVVLQKRIVVQTFGYFNVMIDGGAVAFQHEKAKELLAVLIDRQGKFVSSSEIICCLWEDEPVNENTQSRCRKAAYHLRKILKQYGLETLMESTTKGYRRIRTEMIDCDLYRYLAGRRRISNASAAHT